MDLWQRVDVLIERASTVTALHSHRLHLYAAWRWRSLGRSLDRQLVELERGAAVQRLSLPAVVRLVRDAYAGPLILLKGADVAARYPRPELRPSLDLDFLAGDAAEAQEALLARGFRVCEETEDSHHHLPTLEWPGLMTRVEIHSAPSWPTWLTPVPTDELFEASTAESVLGHGIRTPPPSHHVLLLTAHMWREAPLTRLGQLLDVFLMAHGLDSDETEALARLWRIDALWSTTESIARRIFLEEPTGSRVSRMLTRRLESVRERTVIESKLSELLAPFWGLPPRTAFGASGRLLATNLRPEPTESWEQMTKRSVSAVAQSFRPRSERDRRLEEEKFRSVADD